MSIPDLNENGLLPVGIHPCTMEEVRDRFGQTVLNSSRFDLMGKLSRLCEELQNTGQVRWIGVDGSFVTDKESPGDVDVLVVLPRDHDYVAELRPFEYNALSGKRVRRRYGIDILTAREESDTYHTYEALFRDVKDHPELEKGFLRVDL